MDLYFWTVNRTAPVRQWWSIFKLEFDKKKIISEYEIYPIDPNLDHDSNPRWNTRWCRWVKKRWEKIIACWYHTIYIFNHNLELEKTISDNLLVWWHEIDIVWDDIYISSTSIDAILIISLKTWKRKDYINIRNDLEWQKILNIEPLEINENEDQRANFLWDWFVKTPHHSHLNAVAVHENGDIYALLHRFWMIVNISQKEIFTQHKKLYWAHNLEIHWNSIWSSDSKYWWVISFHLETGEVNDYINLKSYHKIRSVIWTHYPKYYFYKLLSKIWLRKKWSDRPLYVRWLRIIWDTLYVGFSPATFVTINLSTKEIINMYQFSKNVSVCTHWFDLV